jgi:hypothetical protein
MNPRKIGGYPRNLRGQKGEDRLLGGVRYNVGSFDKLIRLG